MEGLDNVKIKISSLELVHIRFGCMHPQQQLDTGPAGSTGDFLLPLLTWQLWWRTWSAAASPPLRCHSDSPSHRSRPPLPRWTLLLGKKDTGRIQVLLWKSNLAVLRFCGEVQAPQRLNFLVSAACISSLPISIFARWNESNMMLTKTLFLLRLCRIHLPLYIHCIIHLVTVFTWWVRGSLKTKTVSIKTSDFMQPFLQIINPS